ncbi:hypothetical protein BBJ28_00009449 [Nothophytophthora sp. Chile5]|nr:hypothetical protein BBJ28_00009449 [Nothophytophthora sp. Chile5]
MTSPATANAEKRRQSERSPFSLLSTLSQHSADEESTAVSDSIRPPEQQRSGKVSMRAEIQELREEMELRRQEELDQLSTLLETLMDRFDAVVEENRALRQENEWLKSHVPPS